MSDKFKEEAGDVYLPAFVNIGKKYNSDDKNSSVSYVNNSSLPATQATAKNLMYSKLQQKKRKKLTPSESNKIEKETIEGNRVKDAHPSSCAVTNVSMLELQVSEPLTHSSKSMKPDNGLKYVENYKSLLRNRGIKYQEIFGHTPRKPDQRLGSKVVKYTSSNPTPVNLVSFHRTEQNSPSESLLRQSPEFKLPVIVTETDDYSVTLDSFRQSFTSNDDVSSTTKTEDISSFVDTLSQTHTEDDDYNSDRHGSSSLIPNSGVARRRHSKKRGRLGEVMTKRRMKELLETNEPIKLENYFNVYS